MCAQPMQSAYISDCIAEIDARQDSVVLHHAHVPVSPQESTCKCAPRYQYFMCMDVCSTASHDTQKSYMNSERSLRNEFARTHLLI
jgi:hypothetical protein